MIVSETHAGSLVWLSQSNQTTFCKGSEMNTANHANQSNRYLLGTLMLALLLACSVTACKKPASDQQAKEAQAEQTASSDEQVDADQSADADDEEAGQEDKKGRRGRWGKGGKKKKAAPIPVDVMDVALRSVSSSYQGTATLSAESEADVVAKTNGILLTLKAEEGDVVKQGQVLATLERDRLSLEVARNQAALNKLQAEYARSQELVKRDLIAKDTVEKQKYDIRTQSAATRLSRLELSYTKVKAPISGVIASRLVKVGNNIQANQTLFKIIDHRRLEAVVNVPEREMSALKAGLNVVLQADALPGKQFKGVVDRVSPVVDAKTGTFRVTAQFDGSDGVLKPGMFTRLSIVHGARDGVLTMPRSALVNKGGERYVFVANAGKAEKRTVRIGFADSQWVEVLQGVQEGERVIVSGKVAIKDATKIDVIDDPTDDPKEDAETTEEEA